MNIKPQIEEWKRRLLDLSKRNSLLNFKERRSGTIKIDEPSYISLFENLLDEKSLKFANYKMVPSEDDPEELVPELTKYDVRSDRDIKTEQNILKGLKKKAKAVLEEQGVNTLFAAFGFLHWKDVSGGNDEFSSPLLLVPVTITKENAIEPYILSALDDDVTLNPTLVHQLSSAFGIEFPEFNADNDIEQYFRTIEKLIKSQEGWRIERSVQISTFSFLKINMYQDLTNNIDMAQDNCFVQALAGEKDAIKQQIALQELAEMDYETVDPMTVYQVLDADSSQQEAIEAAKKGISFILQGPPGTGKSQTITNIIAESLAQGKKILFVSEKEAALNVVKNRLGKTNILDFCLPLHSHKANKKEIIAELYRTAELNKRTVREAAMAPLKRLVEEKEKLNGISEELHCRHKPLDKSVFEANGELASLENIRNVIFDIPDIKGMSTDQYERIISKIIALKESFEASSDDRFAPEWNDCKLDYVRNQDITEFNGNIDPVLDKNLRTLFDDINRICPTHEGCRIRLIDIPHILKFLEHCLSHSCIPDTWATANINTLETEAHRWKNLFTDSLSSIKAVADFFENPPLSFDCDNCANNANKLEDYLIHQTSVESPGKANSSYKAVISEIQKNAFDALRHIERLELQQSLAALNGFDIISYSPNDNSRIAEYLECYSLDYAINEAWFTSGSVDHIGGILSQIKTKLADLHKLEKTTKEYFDNGVESIDAESMIRRFRTDYDTVFRVFKKGYKQDIATLKGYYKNGKLNYKNAFARLSEIRDLKECTYWFTNQKADIDKYFGENFIVNDTAIEKAEAQFSKFKVIASWFNGQIPESVKKDILLAHNSSPTVKDAISEMRAALSNVLNTKNCKQFSSPNRSSYNSIKQNARYVTELIDSVLSDLDRLETAARHSVTDLSILGDLRQWQIFQLTLQQNSEELKSSFGPLFNNANTDWDSIINCLQWMTEFNKFKDELSVNDDFIYSVLEDKNGDIASLHDSISTIFRFCAKRIDWFNQWFTEERSLNIMPIDKALSIVEFYIGHIDHLECWINFHKCIAALKGENLGTYVDQVICNTEIDVSEYLPIFKKRFLSLWIDCIIEDTTYLKSMSHQDILRVIREFKKDDKGQFPLAQWRIYQLLSENLPSVNSMVSANDQMGVLKKEFGKKRRQLPLRKLFAQIPMLVQELKPCMMMSPLSVSLFLQSKDYKFDLVIFDEASQIKPETAIGSIMRGKQIIIAGDTNQLPPTSFFDKAVSGEEYDDDQDFEDDTMLEESILSAGALILPEVYLKWHYRSRHEHLIAFSNMKIYDSRLTTFPSVIDHKADNGVELVYVEDGVFDRGGRKNNLKEAEKVAELVFQHIKKHPNRSLGIIANSESQADAIEEAVERKRLSHNDYEFFFNEANEEPFFIKSLESVQGDERDTIIFSVGYAKDANGKFYRSFGPLSNEGGERRLNVAITRAKFNLKLVTSILPEEIDLSENAHKGPKLLKTYIDFARRGMPALNGEITDNNTPDFDSPFEESVYNFIRENGFEVSSQVGCAGYRIDLAVKHPKLKGQYVLGIECDGAMYHSSRSARERDRLRQEVLENIGWRIYRIWSTEWVKRTAEAKKQLLDAIHEAIDGQKYESYQDENETPTRESITEVIVEERSLFEGEKNYGFVTYVFAGDEVWNPDGLGDRINLLLKVEAPMHIDDLCRRMAPHMGREKATSVVRESVSWELSYGNHKKEYSIVDDFVYLKPIATEYVMRERDKIDATYVCPEELEFAMLAVTRTLMGAAPAVVVEETAHAIGYAHCREKVRTRLEYIYSRLIKQGLLIETSAGAVKVKS